MQLRDSKDCSKEPESKFVLYSIAFLTLIFVGRLNELHPFLWRLHLVWVGFFIAITSIVFSTSPKNSLRYIYSGVPGVYILLIFVLSFLSIWGGVWPSRSLSFFVELGYRMLYFSLVAISLTSIKGISFLLKTMVIIYVVLVLAALIHPTYLTGSDRIFVTSSYDPNDLALLLASCIPTLFFLLFVENNKKNKCIFIVLFILGIVVIVRTGSRGGLLALFAGILFMIKQYGTKKLIIPLLVVSLVTTFVVSASDHNQIARLGTIFDIDSDYNMESDSGRIAIWKRGVGLMVDNPLFGSGLGTYSVADGQSKESGKWLTAHNSYIQLGVELGAPALLLFLLMVFKSFCILNKVKNSNAETSQIVMCVQGALVVYCVGGAFLSWAYAFLLYLILALTSAIYIHGGGWDGKLERTG